MYAVRPEYGNLLEVFRGYGYPTFNLWLLIAITPARFLIGKYPYCKVIYWAIGKNNRPGENKGYKNYGKTSK